MIISVDDIWPTKIVIIDNLLQIEEISIMKNDLIKKSMSQYKTQTRNLINANLQSQIFI